MRATDDGGKKPKPSLDDMSKIMSIVEKMTGRALTLVTKLEESQQSTSLWKLDEYLPSAIENALLASRGDQVLVIGSVAGVETERNIILFSSVKEEGLRRDLAIYSGQSSHLYLGQVAQVHLDKDSDTVLVGIDPISIFLR
jgi:hypothetical protein